jgi:hypothetical protein
MSINPQEIWVCLQSTGGHHLTLHFAEFRPAVLEPNLKFYLIFEFEPFFSSFLFPELKGAI